MIHQSCQTGTGQRNLFVSIAVGKLPLILKADNQFCYGQYLIVTGEGERVTM